MSPVGANSTIGPRPGGSAAGRLSALDDARNVPPSVRFCQRRGKEEPRVLALDSANASGKIGAHGENKDATTLLPAKKLGRHGRITKV